MIVRGYCGVTALFVACACQLEESTTVSIGPPCEILLATVVELDAASIRPDDYGFASEDDSACPEQCGPPPEDAEDPLLLGCVLRAPRRQDPAGDSGTSSETDDADADADAFEDEGIRLLDCLWWQSCLYRR
jgi:hypothetical protein